MDSICEIRVSTTTDPAKLATKLNFKFTNCEVVKLVAIGNAVTLCTKSIGLLKKFNPNIKYRFDIDSFYDTSCNRNVTEIYVFRCDVKSSCVIETLTCDSFTPYRIQTLVNRYISNGYKLTNNIPIVENGSTTCIQFVFTKED